MNDYFCFDLQESIALLFSNFEAAWKQRKPKQLCCPDEIKKERKKKKKEWRQHQMQKDARNTGKRTKRTTEKAMPFARSTLDSC